MSLPIVLIVDDPAPLGNVYWWHAAEAQATENPLRATGEAVARALQGGDLVLRMAVHEC